MTAGCLLGGRREVFRANWCVDEVRGRLVLRPELRRRGAMLRRFVRRQTAVRRAGNARPDERRPRGMAEPAALVISAEDAVELGHRILLGRPPDATLRAALVAKLAMGTMTPGDVYQTIAASPEFAARAVQQAAVLEAARPPVVEDAIDVAELRDARSIPNTTPPPRGTSPRCRARTWSTSWPSRSAAPGR
jgi:hypothetical protein